MYKTEYVIFGYTDKTDYSREELLLNKFDGQYITDIKMAKNLVYLLETKYNCLNCRIQSFDGSKPDFTKTLNI